jgi:hypothetical protein
VPVLAIFIREVPLRGHEPGVAQAGASEAAAPAAFAVE